MVQTSTVTSETSRRDRYLAAAYRLFAELGYDRTTMDMIVAEVGGSKATLYRSFPAKEALIAGLMDQVADGINRSVIDPATDTRSLQQVLTDTGTDALRGVLSPEAATLLRLCLGEYHRFPDLARVVWEHGPAVTYANFKALVTERVRRGELAVDDAQLAAEHFVAGVVGHLQLKIAMGQATPPDEDEIARRVAAAVRAFTAAYGVG